MNIWYEGLTKEQFTTEQDEFRKTFPHDPKRDPKEIDTVLALRQKAYGPK
jgi:hypothetical protein